ncbi:PqqD family protein [Halomonas sp. EGI 63088]|uniref:PqqD family protein n=1 Tax=Halomonas flagellata TaxID=2920385 RepID=A0ABS9RP65_9GAMM|nr:PqqD family protein [Halomonas flagellata]MCH4561775.1 PqqD family protein [Halomonas flagellata]
MSAPVPPDGMRVQDLGFEGLGAVLRLNDAPEVQRLLGDVTPGWRSFPLTARGPAPAIRLARDSRGAGRGYCQHSPELPRGLHLPTPVAAACSLVADLIGAFFTRHTELIGLHCGAAEVAGRLVLFPESHRAGKSTLAAAFATAGHRIFGDDVLALTPAGEGMALGIAPRLRLPLPTRLDPALHAFAERHAGPEDERYRYLVLPEALQARHGECLPLGAIVLLERDATLATPEFIALAPGEGLLQLLCQHLAHAQPSETLMERFLPLMASLPCVLLRYAEPLAAARCLATQLAGPSPAHGSAAVSLTGHRPASRVASRVPADRRWRVRERVRDYPLGDDLFLIHAPSGAIHRLNASGRAVWTLLSHEALTAGEIADLLSEHFGGVSTERIEADASALLGMLAEAELIRPA